MSLLVVCFHSSDKMSLDGKPSYEVFYWGALQRSPAEWGLIS